MRNIAGPSKDHDRETMSIIRKALDMTTRDTIKASMMTTIIIQGQGGIMP